ncbi:hypothetical protein [Variovorax sp. E3]|uniref:hypothetical protein n=1 Tax=Variovorax sp. E3 TaxID=1914993 RepID=UPI0018DCF0B5|nr:hypothetical protein [Variovorax sp. E3]
MVRIIEVDLGRLGLRFPRSEVGMVIAQPYVKFSNVEPFPLLPKFRDGALAGIDATLAIALNTDHGAEKTHFTVFPECTLPGLEGFDRINAAMTADSWPAGTVVIGGFEGLTPAQFTELVGRPGTTYDHDGNSLTRLHEDHWVNCCVTWAKVGAGDVRSWIQPKIEPAGVELNVPNERMFKGRSIFRFRGTYADTHAPYQFATLICFDWIGVRDERRIWEWLLRDIEQAASVNQAQLPLTWLFVAQCNPEPSHTSFMAQVQPFFSAVDFPGVLREDTCLVMANVAGNAVPGGAAQYGRSAVIFATGKFQKAESLPTFCGGGPIQRPGNPLENYRDAVFRERGACIHSFRQLNPGALPAGAAGKRFALADAAVHPFPGTNDPRAPARLVPAAVKWVNDELDDPQKSLAVKFPTWPLAGAVGIAHQRSVDVLRWLPSPALSRAILIASPGTKACADEWEKKQGNAVKHVLNTFSILDVAQYPTQFHALGPHASIFRGDIGIEVVAVSGRSHEECNEHIASQALVHRGQLLVVSRDEENTSWNPRFGRFLDQGAEKKSEVNITDPRSAVIQIGFQDFLRAYQEAANEAALRGAIDAAIS